MDGQKKVKIFGEEVEVRAKIEYIEAYSGHADKSGLFSWIEQMNQKPKKIFVVHGEKEVQFEFAKELQNRFKTDVIVPMRGEVYEIAPEYVTQSERLFSELPSFVNLSVLAQIEEIEYELNRLKEGIKNSAISPERLSTLNSNLEELRYLLSLALNDY